MRLPSRSGYYLRHRPSEVRSVYALMFPGGDSRLSFNIPSPWHPSYSPRPTRRDNGRSPRRTPNNVILQVHTPIRALVRREPAPLRYRPPQQRAHLVLHVVFNVVFVLGAAAFVLELGDITAPARLRLFCELAWGARVRVREFAERARAWAGLVEYFIWNLCEETQGR